MNNEVINEIDESDEPDIGPDDVPDNSEGDITS